MTDESFEHPLGPEEPRRRLRASTRAIVLILSVIVLVGAAAAAFALMSATPTTTPAASESPSASGTPSSSAAPSRTPVPPTADPIQPYAVVSGGVESWTLASDTTAATVGPLLGEAYDGRSSLYIDVPSTRDGEVVVASQLIATNPGEQYRLVVTARILGGTNDVTAFASVNGVRERLSLTADSWDATVLLFEAVDLETSVEIVVGAGSMPFVIDLVEVRPSDGGDSIVTNGSFESVSANMVIANTSLVLRASTAAIAIASSEPSVSWSVTNDVGVELAAGVSEGSQGLALIPLTDVGQGLRNLVVDRGPEGILSTNVALVDSDTPNVLADPRLGVSAHLERPEYEGSVRSARDIGVGILRNDVQWRFNEPSPGNIEFQPVYLDQFARVTASGMGLLPIVAYGNPAYDNGQAPTSPSAAQAYANYARAVVETFKPAQVQIYNEFNHDRFNATACGATADCYLPILRAAADSIRSVAPDTLILGGETALYEAEWFRTLWAVGGANYLDAAGFHPYETYGNPDSIGAVVQQAKLDMAETGAGDIPVWITEMGWTTKTGDVGDATQANNLIKSAISTLASGGSKFFWYDLIDDSRDPADHEGNFGLFTQADRGVSTFAPKHSAFAYALLVNKLGGKDYLTAEATGSITSYVFGTDDDSIRVAWSNAGETLRIPTTEALSLTAADGSVQVVSPGPAGEILIPLGLQPIFIESAGTATGVPTPSSSAAPTPTSAE